MKLHNHTWLRCLILIAFAILFSCNKPGVSESASKDRSKPIKQNSPLDESKKVKSREMMMNLSTELEKIPGTIHFRNIVGHAWSNHLFVNAEHQGYLVICVSDKGINEVYESERLRLQDTSTFNNAYQLKFLIHHLLKVPKKLYTGLIYSSLAGEDIYIDNDRKSLRHKNKNYAIRSSHRYADNMEIVLIDAVLYF